MVAVVFFHYFRLIMRWKNCAIPPLKFKTVIKLTNMHTHSWIWGHIDYLDVYLPTFPRGKS